MGQAIKILPITERFINEYNRLKDAGKLPPNTELAELMDINTPSTISNILKRKQNIKPEAWEIFRKEFRISEASGNGHPDQQPGSLLTGAKVTLQDYINKIEEHNVFLQYVIKNGLVDLQANLMTGQHQLKEQLFAVGESLGQQLDGISSGLAAKDQQERPVVKKDKGVSGRQKESDGKDKSH